MSYQSTPRKTNPSKTEKAGDNATAATPLAKRMRLLGLNALQPGTDSKTCDRTQTKQQTMLLTVL